MRAPWDITAKTACRALITAGLFAVLAATLVRPASASDRRWAPRAESPIAGSVIALLNQERESRGLRPLRRSPRLDEAAGWHSRDMVEHRFFGHHRRGGPGTVERIRRTGYLRGATSWFVAENIGWAEAELASPAHFVSDWMHSRDHRVNILDRSFRSIGIGVAPGAPSGNGALPALTITTDFGVRSG